MVPAIGRPLSAARKLARPRERRVDGPGSFQVAFLDELYKASAEDIAHNPFELEEA